MRTTKTADTSLKADGEKMMGDDHKILVLGMSAGGADSLSVAALARIRSADLLAGGKRHLSYFPDFPGETIPITADVEAVALKLQAAYQAGRHIVVLASGDPLCYGMGGTLRRWFAAEALEIWPAATAFQLAFAALGEPWQGAALLSAHARPLADVVAGVHRSLKAAILTDNKQTPPVVATALIAGGIDPSSFCAVCENLGSPAEQIIKLTLSECRERTFAPLNVMVVIRESVGEKEQEKEDVGTTQGTRLMASDSQMAIDYPHSVCLPDHLFATEKGQLTKREVRILSLAELALGEREVMWDIGAGSGAVSIDAARLRRSAQIWAVEKRPLFCQHIAENSGRFGVTNIRLVQGDAPEVCQTWPDPDAVFIGGSGGRLADIVAVAQARLKSNGRLVANVVTLENLICLRTLLPEAQVTQVQIGRGRPIVEMIRFEALNPVFVVVWRKPAAP